jgi:hypothetical protein
VADTPFIVYGLIDPRNGQLRYVGKTTQLSRRMHYHASKARGGVRRHVYDWLRSLSRAGCRPEVQVLESCGAETDLDEAECHHIAYFKMLGCDLTNLTSGGEGVRANEAVRQKLALAARNQWLRMGDKMRASLKGHKKSVLNSSARGVVDELGVSYRSASAAGIALGLDPRAISRAAKRGWQVAGHTFKYME